MYFSDHPWNSTTGPRLTVTSVRTSGPITLSGCCPSCTDAPPRRHWCVAREESRECICHGKHYH